RFPLLLDAKYKRLDPADRKLGISPADFYQMHAYAHRYQCPCVLLLYPQTAEMDTPLRVHFTLADSGKRIEATTIDLRVDLSTSEGKRNLIEQFKRLLQEHESYE